MGTLRLLALTGAIAAASLTLEPATASARGGSYALYGGTKAERTQVVAALNASAFDWSIVPARIRIHISRDLDSSDATRGEIWLDADLLDAGVFGWGVVQHEYAHQVDFFVLDDAKRATLNAQLGGKDWCDENPSMVHADRGCERFASTLAWSYWPSPDNCLRPHGTADESAAMPPAKFRALLSQLLGLRNASVR